MAMRVTPGKIVRGCRDILRVGATCIPVGGATCIPEL